MTLIWFLFQKSYPQCFKLQAHTHDVAIRSTDPAIKIQFSSLNYDMLTLCSWFTPVDLVLLTCQDISFQLPFTHIKSYYPCSWICIIQVPSEMHGYIQQKKTWPWTWKEWKILWIFWELQCNLIYPLLGGEHCSSSGISSFLLLLETVGNFVCSWGANLLKQVMHFTWRNNFIIMHMPTIDSKNNCNKLIVARLLLRHKKE